MTDRPLPSVYAPGPRLPASGNRTLSDLYLRHVHIADPPADAAIASLAGMSPAERQRHLDACLRSDERALAGAPSPVRDLFRSLPADPPAPFDPAAVRRARETYNAHSDIFIQAFVIATLRNLSTTMAVPPAMTGVYASDRGLRPLRYAARHFHELMIPGSLEHRGDAWKLSVHIRLVHAAARASLEASPSWDRERHGPPIHAAHLGLGSANYSVATLDYAALLGARLDPASRRGFMQVWRHASLLLGVPPELLFDADETRTREFADAAHLCEPPPGPHAADIVNAVIRSLPAIAGSPTQAASRRLVSRAYRVSRTLLPRDACDALGFPGKATLGYLPWLRLRHAVRAAWFRANRPAFRRWQRARAEFYSDILLPRRLRYAMPPEPSAGKPPP